jgi:hypothetical protein
MTKESTGLRPRSRSILLLGISLLIWQMPALAAEGEASEGSPTGATAASRPAPVDRDIEEIEIIGQRSNQALRLEIQRVEERMFSLFNDLNSSDEFDVTCGKVTHTGTLIPVWECDVGYLKRARHLDALDFLQFGFPARTEEQLYWDLREKSVEMNTEMRALALEHPELAEAMLTLNAKRNELAEREREKRSSGGLLSRMFGRNKD